VIWLAVFWLFAALMTSGPLGVLCWGAFWVVAAVTTFRMIRPERR
jgi:hypothetical protein